MIYHYTTIQKFPAIISTGLVKLGRYNLKNRLWHAAWFSKDQHFEYTSCQLRRRVDGADLPPRDFGYGRIGVDETTAPHTFEQYVRDRRVPADLKKKLLDAAADMGGDPADWRCSYRPVPRTAWQTAEVLWRGEWIDAARVTPHLMEIIDQAVAAWSAGLEVKVVDRLPEPATTLTSWTGGGVTDGGTVSAHSTTA